MNAVTDISRLLTSAWGKLVTYLNSFPNSVSLVWVLFESEKAQTGQSNQIMEYNWNYNPPKIVDIIGLMANEIPVRKYESVIGKDADCRGWYLRYLFPNLRCTTYFCVISFVLDWVVRYLVRQNKIINIKFTLTFSVFCIRSGIG